VEVRRGYSESYDQSLQSAVQAYRDQDRARDDTLDITHAFHVSVILLRHGFSDDVAIAGLLHDSIEKPSAHLIEAQLETPAAGLVNLPPGSEASAQGWDRSWTLQKREALDRACRAGWRAVAVVSADALLHARHTAQRVLREDALARKHLSRDSTQMLSYCLQVLQVAREELGCHSLVGELADAVQGLMWTIEITAMGRSDTDHQSLDELERVRDLNRAQLRMSGGALPDPAMCLYRK
jgi:(p)ppGpp synthase/HD superfamily hydrolase